MDIKDEEFLVQLATTGEIDELQTMLTPSLSEHTIHSLLIAAAKNSQVGTLQLVLEKHPSITIKEETVRAAVNTGSQPLFAALLAHDATCVNMPFEMRGTPLTVACMGQQSIDYLRFLLEAGADPNQDPDAAVDPLAIVAGLYSDVAAAELVVQHGGRIAHSSALAAACQRGNVTMLHYLLRRGARPETDASPLGVGTPPLHIAVKAEHPGAARALLEHGADSEVKDGNGATPLEVAMKMHENGKDMTEMMETLAEYMIL